MKDSHSKNTYLTCIVLNKNKRKTDSEKAEPFLIIVTNFN